MEGLVFNIQHCCTHDGPGLRTTVFLKGCPLRCAWCHNPESHSGEPQVSYEKERCIGCWECRKVCPHGCHHPTEQGHGYHRQDCVMCGVCIEKCPTQALSLCGTPMSVEDVLREVEADRLFYENSGGGLTVSGGEPLMQFSFLKELLAEAKKRNIHVCLETSGYAPEPHIREIAEYTDLFLYDFKHYDPVLHEKYTGVSNIIPMRNLQILNSMGKQIILTCPIIPFVNDMEEHFTAIAELANSLSSIRGVLLRPYHSLGTHKAEGFRMQNMRSFTVPTARQTENWKHILAQKIHRKDILVEA